MPKRRSEASFNDTVIGLIFDQPQPDETPASRLKQVGLMIVLHQMKRQDIETTIPKMVSSTGVSRAAATVILEPLLRKGMLLETKVLNVTGKGHAIRLDFCPELGDFE